MLFYIEAKVFVKVAGISGKFQETYVKLVHANNINDAKSKFESYIRKIKASAMPEVLEFEYLKFGDELH